MLPKGSTEVVVMCCMSVGYVLSCLVDATADKGGEAGEKVAGE